MDLFHGDATSAIIAYQGRVSNFLNVREARDLVMDCSQLGVPSYILETLLCHTLARYELIPRRIEIMRSARKKDRQALIYLAWIDDVMTAANYTASQTTAILEIEDLTGFEDEVRDALGAVIDRFEDGSEREKDLRAKLGVPLVRIRARRRAEIRAHRIKAQQESLRRSRKSRNVRRSASSPMRCSGVSVIVSHMTSWSPVS